MTVFNEEYKISYYSVPKCACTSVKSMFFEIENGFEFRLFRVNGTVRHIHNFYNTLPFPKASQLDRDDHYRFAIIRDPVSRLLSCYSNRVVAHKELKPGLLPQEALDSGLYPDPSLSDFIENLEGYRKYSNSIRHHSNPLTFFLGDDPSYFSKLFTLGELDEMVQTVGSMTGKPLKLSHQQKGGPKLSKNDLSEREIKKLQDFYAQDYESFGSVLGN